MENPAYRLDLSALAIRRQNLFGNRGIEPQRRFMRLDPQVEQRSVVSVITGTQPARTRTPLETEAVLTTAKPGSPPLPASPMEHVLQARVAGTPGEEQPAWTLGGSGQDEAERIAAQLLHDSLHQAYATDAPSPGIQQQRILPEERANTQADQEGEGDSDHSFAAFRRRYFSLPEAQMLSPQSSQQEIDNAVESMVELAGSDSFGYTEAAINPVHRDLLYQIREVYQELGFVLYRTPEAHGGANSHFRSPDSASKLYFNNDIPTILQTPLGSYVVIGNNNITENRPAMTQLVMEQLSQDYYIEVLREQRDPDEILPDDEYISGFYWRENNGPVLKIALKPKEVPSGDVTDGYLQAVYDTVTRDKARRRREEAGYHVYPTRDMAENLERIERGQREARRPRPHLALRAGAQNDDQQEVGLVNLYLTFTDPVTQEPIFANPEQARAYIRSRREGHDSLTGEEDYSVSEITRILTENTIIMNTVGAGSGLESGPIPNPTIPESDEA